QLCAPHTHRRQLTLFSIQSILTPKVARPGQTVDSLYRVPGGFIDGIAYFFGRGQAPIRLIGQIKAGAVLLGILLVSGAVWRALVLPLQSGHQVLKDIVAGNGVVDALASDLIIAVIAIRVAKSLAGSKYQ